MSVCSHCFLAQVDCDVSPDELFKNNYAYFSSYSESWVNHAKKYCDMIQERLGLTSSSLVVELASNDGYLLRNFVAAGIKVLGIDPSDTVSKAAEAVGVPTLVEFFGADLARKLVAEGRQADLIVANNVLAHVPSPNDFIHGISILLKPEGTITVEFPHLLTLMEGLEFDTIYHEHYSYLSLFAIENVFARFGMKLYDVEELPTHGGSLRIFASLATRPGLTVSDNLLAVRAKEKAAGLHTLDTYADYGQRVAECRTKLLAFLHQAKSEGKVVAGYGAAAKGNTLLNYCGVTTDLIPFVADLNPNKQGKFLPGSHIPVVTPQHLMEAKPDYVLILPWNIKAEIFRQLADVRGWGGRFVTAIPEVTVYE